MFGSFGKKQRPDASNSGNQEWVPANVHFLFD